MKFQEQPRPPLDGEVFDVVIVGGGINGVAIARECARGGRRTLLVEQNDFASGTTSRSTRIIHGGLRYLEHGEIGLVRESLRERQRLLTERPHLIRAMKFVLALPPGRRSSLEIRFGLWLYRRFAGSTQSGASNGYSIDRFLDAQGDASKLRIFTYDDAQCEFPERLVAEWLLDAIEAGVVVRNHTRAIEVRSRNGRVRGVRLRDELQGDEYEVQASHIFNATGPWVDRVCRESKIETTEPLIGGLRGSHILVHRFPEAPTTPVYTQAEDGRPVFLIPWNGQILFGTTEVLDNGNPANVQPSASEVEYLVTSLQRLFPRTTLPEPSHAFAGVRPLAYASGESAAAITRRHFLHDHSESGAGGLISVVGGKLTTAASLAREAARSIGINVIEPRSTAIANGTALTASLDAFTSDVAQTGGIALGSARELVSRHGGRSIAIAELLASDDRLRQPLVEASDYLVGEAKFAVNREVAVTLADILLRRVPIALSHDWTDEVAQQTAQRLAAVLGWDAKRTMQEIDAFEAERSAFLVKPSAVRVAV